MELINSITGSDEEGRSRQRILTYAEKRLDGSRMLQLLRGKRLVFVGDSLNRNMWESLICILRNSVKDKTKVYEASGRHHFRSEASYAFVFKDYNCTVEFFMAPFLVQEWEMKDKNGTKKETLRLDLTSSAGDQYKTTNIVVFNTGHWWTHDNTAKGQDYYQEGSHVYPELNVLEAFRKAMTTWGMWVDASINPTKTSVFFRGQTQTCRLLRLRLNVQSCLELVPFRWI